MKKNTIRFQGAGFTLTEICVGLTILTIVGGLAYSMLVGSTTLLTKNLSLNSSNTSVRATLDRVYSEINQANGLPKLINADGSPVTLNADGTGGPAAGILFDRYVGGPFVVGNPGTGLPANTTSFKLYYYADPAASPSPSPPPTVKNDVVIMDGVTRALVSSSTNPSSSFSNPIPVPAPSSSCKVVTVTLQNTLGSYTNPTVSSGTAIPWTSNVQQTAFILHRKAFIVATVNGRAELRMYPDAETVTDYNDASKYTVISREIGNQAGENTPFSIVAQDAQGHSLGANFLSIAMRVEDQQFNKYLANKQAKEFNTFLRVEARSRPRNFLQ